MLNSSYKYQKFQTLEKKKKKKRQKANTYDLRVFYQLPIQNVIHDLGCRFMISVADSIAGCRIILRLRNVYLNLWNLVIRD